LKKRGKLYSLRAYIPAELAGKHRTSSGKPKTEKLYALGTSDRQEALRKARLLVPKVVQDIYGTPDPQEYEWKPDTERLIRYANHPDERFESPLKPIERVGVRRDTHPDLEQAAENIAFQRGLKVATDWVAKATGKVVLGTAADAYLSFMEQRGRPANERTRKRRVTHIKEFAAWWDEDSTPLNALKPMDADRFIGHLREDGNAPATINSKISSMSNLWRWASTRGHADSNIWSDQSVS
ncbi:unnamed protein product, partial [Ectocarpus sp. 13 AM-2016]